MSKAFSSSSNRHETRVAGLEDDQAHGEIYFQRPAGILSGGQHSQGQGLTRVLPGMQSEFVDSASSAMPSYVSTL